jgi:protoporphyrin/coproporphyrin ferrochelatase
MKFAKQTSYPHGSPARVGVLLVNLGTPEEATPAAVGHFLREFLRDPRVVELPRWLWWPILYAIVVPRRARASAAKYASVWSRDGSPLKVWTEKLAKLLRGRLGVRGAQVLVESGMRYGSPSIAGALDRLAERGASQVLVVPLYPQYCAATTASSCDAIAHWCSGQRRLPQLRFINHYHDEPRYIEALAQSVRDQWAISGAPSFHGHEGPSRPWRLVVSFHGMPARTLALGDPYHCECQKTARLLAEALGLATQDVLVSFQSRFGRARWLEPATATVLRALPAQGVRVVNVICPGFAVDCLETLEEIAIEGKAEFLNAGGKQFNYVPCLNDRNDWVEGLTDIVMRELHGWLDPDDGTVPGKAVDQRELAMRLGAKA